MTKQNKYLTQLTFSMGCSKGGFTQIAKAKLWDLSYFKDAQCII